MNAVSSNLSVHDVLRHLHNMYGVFNDVKDLGAVDLYVYFSRMEKDYVFEGKRNYAMTVHQLSPLSFQKDKRKIALLKGKTDIAISDRMICPYCSSRLPPKDGYLLHIKQSNVYCDKCREVITYEAFVLATFVWNFNRGDYAAVKVKGFLGVLLTFDKSNATWKAFSSYLLQLLKTNENILAMPSTEQRKESFNLRKEIRGHIAAVRNNISSLSFDLIQGLYRQLSFINKICGNYICCNYEYWTNPKIIEESIKRYFKFLDLIAAHQHRRKILVPTMDIDLIWHTHQCLSDSSDSYCNYTRTLMGRILNHDDTIESDGLKKAYARTFIYWARKYGEPYSSVKPEFSDWQRGHNFLSYAIFPVGLYRLHTWNTYSNLVTAPASLSAEVERIRPRPQKDASSSSSSSSSSGGTGKSNGNEAPPIRMMGVPVTRPLAAPNNQLNRNSKDTATRTTGHVASCAGGCGTGACAAGSCGAAGCGGSCGGGAGCAGGGGGCGGGGCGGGCGGCGGCGG